MSGRTLKGWVFDALLFASLVALFAWLTRGEGL